MIKKEFYMLRFDGIRLIRTYSDQNFCIERDGCIYEEAIDPEGYNRIYTETDVPIEQEEENRDDEDIAEFDK